MAGDRSLRYQKRRAAIMSVAVRYYSRSGNTKAVAEAIAKAAGVKAVSVDQKDAALKEPVDVLFIGGALYAYGIDSHLKEYLKSLKKGDAKRAVVFSTSWISKHSIDLIKKGLTEAGIPVAEEYFYSKSKPGDAVLREAAAFAAKHI
jgi:flavodoxin